MQNPGLLYYQRERCTSIHVTYPYFCLALFRVHLRSAIPIGAYEPRWFMKVRYREFLLAVTGFVGNMT